MNNMELYCYIVLKASWFLNPTMFNSGKDEKENIPRFSSQAEARGLEIDCTNKETRS